MVYKALEQILKERVISDINVKGKWDKMQYRFTKSSLYQITQQFSFIIDFLDIGNGIDHFWLNFSKAFDTEKVRKLLNKQGNMENDRGIEKLMTAMHSLGSGGASDWEDTTNQIAQLY